MPAEAALSALLRRPQGQSVLHLRRLGVYVSPSTIMFISTTTQAQHLALDRRSTSVPSQQHILLSDRRRLLLRNS